MSSLFDVEWLLRRLRTVAEEQTEAYSVPPTECSLKHLATKYCENAKDVGRLSGFSVVFDETPRQQSRRNRKARSRRYFVAYRAMRRHPEKSRRYRMWKRVADKHFNGIKFNINIAPVVPLEYINLTFDIVTKP